MQLAALQRRLRETRGRPARAGHRRLEADTREPLRLALGADHGGFRLKEQLKGFLRSLGVDVRDVGAHSTDAVDYPDLAVAVAREVASGACRFGIVIDAAGLGSCMAANKVRGVRAATCHDEMTTRNSREHNDANVLVLGSRVVHPGHARRLVRLWLETPHAGGRHARRVAKVDALDESRPR
ncbi:MAG: ribose 5-phosphate isomerase B [Candidatus Krumholzibacteriia bacterium]